MLRILLINDTAKKVGRLKAALTEAGFEVIDESGLTIDLPARVETVRPDVILIDTESPSRDVMEQVVLVSRDQPRPIVMFTDEHDPDVMRQAIKSGVSAYIVEGIHAQRLQPILDVAMARFESDQALRAQLQRPRPATGRAQAHRAGQGAADEDEGLQRGRGLHPDAPPGHEPPAEADSGGGADHCHE